MTITTQVTGEIVAINRLDSSRYGNPRYEVVLDVGGEYFLERYKTGVDYSVGYSITNHKIGSMVRLTLRGKRENIVKAEEI